MPRFLGFALLTRALVIVLVTAASGLAQDAARMEEAVRSFTPENRFMGAVLVARGEQVLLNKGYESANLYGGHLGARLMSLAHEERTGGR